jgi:UPF0755 protein
MMIFRKKIVILFLIFAFILGSFFYFANKIEFSKGPEKNKKILEIEKGENALELGKKLEENGIISNKYYFVIYLWKENMLHKIVAGEYEFSPNLKIPEIAKIITGSLILNSSVKITFPEGWSSLQMAKRLSENGFSGDDFLNIVKNPSAEIIAKYDFLNDFKSGKSLEGYLFPDTYFFAKDASSENIVTKILDNFNRKVTSQMRQEISNQNKSLDEIISMASIVQKEVTSNEDMKMVSGIFWNRIENGQALQSCATLAFVLGETKKQYSIADTKVNSPYNTYQNKGLTPGPISNPGLLAINATIYPKASDFYYFLSDPSTGQTIFSKTFQEHLANKAKYGL